MNPIPVEGPDFVPAVVDRPARASPVNRARDPAAVLTYIRLLNLKVPFGHLDLLFEQHPLDVSVTVLRKEGDFEVRVIK